MALVVVAMEETGCQFGSLGGSVESMPRLERMGTLVR